MLMQELNERLRTDLLLTWFRSDRERPRTLSQLRDLLEKIVPQHLRRSWGVVELAFPAEFVQGIEQRDVDLLFQAIDPEIPEGRQRYAQVATKYFYINLPTPEDDPDIIPDEKVEKIKRQLKVYGEEGISVPALFFLCLFAVVAQYTRKYRQGTGSVI